MKNSFQKNANRVLHLFTALCVFFSFALWAVRPVSVRADGAYGMTDQEIQYASNLAEKYGTKAFDILTGDTPVNAGGHVAFELAHVLSDMSQSKEYEDYFNEFFGVKWSGSIEGEKVVPRLWRIDDGTNIYNALGDYTVKSSTHCKVKINVYGHSEYNCLLLFTSATTNNNSGIILGDSYDLVNMYPMAAYYIVVGSVYDGLRGGPCYWNEQIGCRWKFQDNGTSSTLTPTKNGLIEYENNDYSCLVTPSGGFFPLRNGCYIGSPYFSAYTVGALNIYEPQKCIDDLISSLVTKYGQEVVDSVYDYDIDFNNIPPTMGGFTFPENLPAVDFHDVDLESATIPQKLIESARFYFNTFDSLADDLGIKPVLIFFLCLALLFAILKI